MNTLEKIDTLGSAAKYDVCASTSCRPDAVKGSGRGEERVGNLTGPGICHSFTPDGRCVSLFKVLMTNNCSNDCRYCANSCGADTRRAQFEPDELRKAFLSLYHQNCVEGLFLSSAIGACADETEDNMLEVIRALRTEDHFRGYIHLKIMPGVGKDMIAQATELADRVSLNLEAPNRIRFQELTSTKDFKIDLLRRMRWVKSELGAESSGQTTQFVVGACGESDYEILKTVDDLYAKMSLRRSYFSAFMPVPGTDFGGHRQTPLVREHRLYQCDFLMRKYDFDLESFVFGDSGRLDLRLDPKMSIAMHERENFPIEINDASYPDLLRVPGIGLQSAFKIAKLTEGGFKFKEFGELKNLGVVMARAKRFISVNGRRQTSLADFGSIAI